MRSAEVRRSGWRLLAHFAWIPALGFLGVGANATSGQSLADPDAARKHGVRDTTALPAASAAPAGDAGRPVFRLPDIVVAGEDQSRLGGGMRILGAEVPGISPEQKPLLIDPGPTQYRRRRGVALRVSLPPAAVPALPRAWLRARAWEGPRGSLALLAVPSSSQRSLIWLDLDGWQERIPGREHTAIKLGWRDVGDPNDSRWRIGLDLRGGRETWQTESRTDRAGSQDALCAAVTIEKRGALGDQGLVWGGALTGGTSRTRYWTTVGGSDTRESRAGNWLALVGDVRTLPGRGDLQARSHSGIQAGLRGGYVRRDGPWSVMSAGGRWEGDLAWRQVVGAGAFEVGLAGGGDGSQDRSLWAPQLRYERIWRDAGSRLELAIAPELTFIDELAVGERRELLQRGPVGRGLEWFAIHSPALYDPDLAPQRAWPRYVLDLFRQSGALELRLTGAVARWCDPFDWRPIAGTRAPLLFVPVNAERRWVAQLTVAVDWRLTEQLALATRYRGVRETERADDAARLLFLPEHEGLATVRATPGIWLAEIGVHARSRVIAGDHGDELPACGAWTGRGGVRVGHSLVALVVENIFAAKIATRPDEVFTDRWFGIEWSHAFGSHVP